MALQWNWKDKMGKLTIRQKGKEYNVNIYSGNALAIFICEYKQNDEERYVMYIISSPTRNIVTTSSRTTNDYSLKMRL